MTLPQRTAQAEQEFIDRLALESDTEVCVDAIQMAIREKRPQLAGKIFAVIREPIEFNQELRKAERALAFFLIQQRDEQWVEFTEQWECFYQKSNQSRRIRARHKPTLDLGRNTWKRRR